MNTLQVSCTGFWINRLFVPPFQVNTGEIVCLHVPRGGIADTELLHHFLSGTRTTPELTFVGTVAWVERPMPRPGFLWRRYNPRVSDWLTEVGGVRLDQAAAILGRLRIPFGIKIGYLSANPRLWVALEAALTRRVDIIVFDSAGSGPDGMQVAYDLLASRLDQHAVIHISQPSNLTRLCYPHARCIHLKTTEEDTQWTDPGTVPAPSIPS